MAIIKDTLVDLAGGPDWSADAYAEIWSPDGLRDLDGDTVTDKPLKVPITAEGLETEQLGAGPAIVRLHLGALRPPLGPYPIVVPDDTAEHRLLTLVGEYQPTDPLPSTLPLNRVNGLAEALDEKLDEATANATYAPRWAASTAYSTGAPVLLPNGLTATRTASGTSRPTYDATEAALWAVVVVPASDKGAASGLAPLDSTAKLPVVNAPNALIRPARSIRTSNPPRTMLATFQSGHGYGTAGTSSNNMNDTSDYVMGTQSASITTAGAGVQAIISKGSAVTTLDMTGKIFAVLIKVTGTAHLNRITLLPGSSNFANNYQMQVLSSLYLPNQEIIPEGRWVWVTLPWVYSTTGGTPSRTAITDLRIAVVDDNTGNQVKVQVQAIATQKERPAAFPSGVISIGFDDNFASQRTYGTSYMDKYGYPATMYTIVDLVGQAGRLTLNDLRQIEEYSGGEVAGHAWTVASHNAGFNTLSAQTLDDELRLTKGWLLDNNFQGRDLFAYPLGNFNTSVIDATAKYYSFARTVNIRQQETLPPGMPFTCRAQSSTNTVTLAQLQAQIDSCQTNGTWLNLLFHDIVTGTASQSVQVTQATFQGAMDYIATKGIPVLTTSQVLRQATA